jgi:hypothetical protein
MERLAIGGRKSKAVKMFKMEERSKQSIWEETKMDKEIST